MADEPKPLPSPPPGAPIPQQPRRIFDNRTELSTNLKRIEDATNELARGIIAPIGRFQVTTSATATTVTQYGCSSTSVVLLMPEDATTALEYGLGTTYATPAKGSFTVTHPSNANARYYRYVVFSGRRL